MNSFSVNWPERKRGSDLVEASLRPGKALANLSHLSSHADAQPPGRPAICCANVCWRWRSSRVPRSEALRRLVRRGRFAVAGFASGNFSRASIAVESRVMYPMSRSFCVASISATCIRCGNSPAENSTKAREKVDSCGMLCTLFQPHSAIAGRFADAPSSDASSQAHKLALARNAAASACRSFDGRPRQPRCGAIQRANGACSAPPPASVHSQTTALLPPRCDQTGLQNM